MSVAKEQAERIAHLARLDFEPEELTRITEELNHILAHVEALKAVEPEDRAGPETDPPPDAAATAGEGSPTRGEGAERPDRLGYPLAALAPDWRDGFFVVPPLPGMHEEGES